LGRRKELERTLSDTSQGRVGFEREQNPCYVHCSAKPKQRKCDHDRSFLTKATTCYHGWSKPECCHLAQCGSGVSQQRVCFPSPVFGAERRSSSRKRKPHVYSNSKRRLLIRIFRWVWERGVMYQWPSENGCEVANARVPSASFSRNTSEWTPAL